jgi:hypothetical protein
MDAKARRPNHEALISYKHLGWCCPEASTLLLVLILLLLLQIAREQVL